LAETANSGWKAFWAAVTQFDAGKMSPVAGLRNGYRRSVAFGGGGCAGQPVVGALMSTGALNVAFSEARIRMGSVAGECWLSSVWRAGNLCGGGFGKQHGRGGDAYRGFGHL